MPTIVKEARLIYSDASANNNKYYYLWLYDDGTIESENGRVGVTSVRNALPKLRGEHDFEKQLKSKIKKGYRELKTVANTSSSTTSAVSSEDLKSIASKQIKTTKPELQKLIDRLVAANIHKITSSTQITYNDTTGLFSTPLGIVTLDAIAGARDLLVDINKHIKSVGYTGVRFLNDVSAYLRLVPQNVGMRLNVQNLFPDDAAIQRQSDILDSLEASYQALKSQPKKISGTNDIVEKVFDVEIDILEDKNEIDRISKWFYSSNHATHGYSHVKIANFFIIKIASNVIAFKSSFANITEVFHSTGEANLLSILKSGLKVVRPSTAVYSGSMFGGGHYGATDSSKSLQYTFGRFNGQRGQSGWTFVADFAMGKPYYIKTYGGDLSPGYDSIYATAKNTGLRFDELIVPNDNQVKLKYLLEVI